MKIELLTRDDLAQLTDQMIILQQQMKEVSDFLKKSADRIITANEICDTLQISYSTFLSKRQELISYCLFNDGKWKMRLYDLQNYINKKSTK
jgi:hypothetical protein